MMEAVFFRGEGLQTMSLGSSYGLAPLRFSFLSACPSFRAQARLNRPIIQNTTSLNSLNRCLASSTLNGKDVMSSKIIALGTSINGSRFLLRRRQRMTHVVQASQEPGREASGEDVQVKVLPIFPLGLVAMPAAETPLHIFEARYRVLFSTLLSGADGIDEGLVSPDKPWIGSRQFGLSFYDNQAGGVAGVGTILHIRQHAMLPDGRMVIDSIGKERYRIVEVVEQKPILVAKVEILNEDEDTSDTAKSLASEVAQMYRDVAKLSLKLKDDTAQLENIEEPAALATYGPRELSFWIASLFAGNPYNQQALLEVNSTMERLEAECEILNSTRKYLSAQLALQSAFNGEGGTDTPSASGPD